VRTDLDVTLLRLSLARIAQACGLERAIPGAQGTDLSYIELYSLAIKNERGWNQLTAMIIDHIEKK
jgi:hypothetical protein